MTGCITKSELWELDMELHCLKGRGDIFGRQQTEKIDQVLQNKCSASRNLLQSTVIWEIETQLMKNSPESSKTDSKSAFWRGLQGPMHRNTAQKAPQLSVHMILWSNVQRVTNGMRFQVTWHVEIQKKRCCAQLNHPKKRTALPTTQAVSCTHFGL